MPRRKKDGLPACVYLKHGAYWLVKRNKWTRLGATLPEMYKALGELATDQPIRTLADIMDRYARDTLPTKARSTQRDQRRQLALLREVFGHMKAADVTTQHVSRYLDQRGGTRANREVALLSHVYRKAIRWGYTSLNPCTGVERNTEAPRDRYVTDDEFWQRWEEVSPPLRLCMELLYLTGQRLGDVLAIRDSRIGDDGIAIAQGKTGTKLVLAWTPALRDVVERCRAVPTTEDDAALLRNRSGVAYTVSGISAMWRKTAWTDEPFQLRDLRAKSASDHPDGSHLGHRSTAVLRKFYERKAREVKGL